MKNKIQAYMRKKTTFNYIQFKFLRICYKRGDKLANIFPLGGEHEKMFVRFEMNVHRKA